MFYPYSSHEIYLKIQYHFQLQRNPMCCFVSFFTVYANKFLINLSQVWLKKKNYLSNFKIAYVGLAIPFLLIQSNVSPWSLVSFLNINVPFVDKIIQFGNLDNDCRVGACSILHNLSHLIIWSICLIFHRMNNVINLITYIVISSCKYS